MRSADATDPPAGYRPMTRPGGFEELIGPIYGAKGGEGDYRLAFRAEDRHGNPQGVVHGGMLMTLVDAVMGIAVWRAIGKRRCATISLNCSFVASGQVDDWLEASAEVVRRGRVVVFMRGDIHAGDRRLITADGVWKVLDG